MAADAAYFHFPAWIECCRARQDVRVPEDLLWAYRAALSRLPALVAEASERSWDNGFMQCALAAVAAAKGQPSVAEAILELDSTVAEEFLEWFHNR